MQYGSMALQRGCGTTRLDTTQPGKQHWVGRLWAEVALGPCSPPASQPDGGLLCSGLVCSALSGSTPLQGDIFGVSGPTWEMQCSVFGEKGKCLFLFISCHTPPCKAIPYTLRPSAEPGA